MSSTVSQTRTELAALGEALPARRVATIVAALVFTVVIVSFRPFQPAGADTTADSGDIVNQLGFGSLGALAVFSLFALADRRKFAGLLSPWWLAMLAMLAISVLNALAPSDAMRGAAFTVIGMLSMASVLVLPRDADSLSSVFVFAALTILALCYFGIEFLPGVAIHSADSIEPQHAGLWRGLFTHKNIAAPVMACLSFMGIYLWRRGRRRVGLAIFILAMIFLANTGSKTTTATVPLAVLMVILPGLIGMRFLVPAALAAVLAIMALATLGIVFIEPLKDLQHHLAPGLTYTGRTSLWEFMGNMIARRPLLGFGFESFWGTGVVLNSDQPFDRAWDIRGIVHGHDSYLDLAVAMGLPALGLAIATFVVVPMRDYLRTPFLKENIWLADLFMMMIIFILMNAFLETFFFHRADPVWMMFVFAILGLRLAARFAMPTRMAG